MSPQRISIKHILHDSDNSCDIQICMNELEKYLRTQPCMRGFPRMSEFWSINNAHDMDMIMADLFQCNRSFRKRGQVFFENVRLTPKQRLGACDCLGMHRPHHEGVPQHTICRRRGGRGFP